MKFIVSMIAAAGLLATGTAMANEPPAKAKTCLAACHALDKKKVGPGWNEVAAKYKGKATAEADIENSILKGSKGQWGGNMPANKMEAAEAKEIAKFIMTLAK